VGLLSDRAVEFDRRLRKLETAPDNIFAGARVSKDIVLSDGVVQRIAHGLSKKLQGYIVVGIRDNDALGTIEDEHDGRHGDTGTFAYLKAVGHSPTVDVLFF
jgi:hypothetical protein